MLPVYKAISFQKVIERGGHTKPWVVIVDAGGTLKPFVVKLFETYYVENNDCVANEIIGNVLSKEFGLSAPNAALIDLDSDFKSTLKNFNLLERIENTDDRLKFGTELLESVLPFEVAAYDPGQARALLDIDSVFAFDNLIRNRDRTRQPPNILISNNAPYLIDHEMGVQHYQFYI